MEDVCFEDILTDASFSLRNGEIIGIAGLVGSGGTGLMKVLFGISRKTSGKVFKRKRSRNKQFG